MKKSFLLYSLCAICCYTASAQATDCILTVEDMKQIYENSLLTTCEKKLAGCDILETKRMTCHIVPNESMRHAEGLELPPSKYVICHNNGLPEYLCWTGIRHEADGKKSEQLFQELVKRYGELMLGDTLRAVPAKWFTGLLSYTGWLRPYIGTMLSDNIDDLNVQAGICLYDDILKRDMENYFHGSLRHDAHMLADADSWLRGIVVLDGPKLAPSVQEWKDKVERWREIYLLSRDVNRICKMRTERGDTLSYTLLLNIDSIGKTHLHVLKPQTQNERDATIVQELSDAIEQQPTGILRASWTYDGRLFPGIIVNARLLWRGWELTDASYDYKIKRQ